MNLYLLPFFSVVFGVCLSFIFKTKNTVYTKLLLSFSGSFLLALTLFDLLPEVYEHLEAKTTGLFIMCGILLQILLEYFSKGAEHGHIHIHKHETQFPWLLFISLCIHSFLEGFPIHEHNDMVYGVFIHNIPIAILLTTYLIQSDFKKIQVFGFLGLFAVMTPLGTLISHSFAMASDVIFYMNAIVIGIFLHISTTILFESSEGHKLHISKLLIIILGVVVAYLI